MRLAAVTLAVLAALAAASSTGRAVGLDDAALLAAYEPVLLFHPDESWAPERVESYLALARVERRVAPGSWQTVPPPLPTSNAGCTLTPCLRLDLPCPLQSGDACYARLARRTTDWTRPVVYGTVVRVPPGAAPPPGFTAPPTILLHYWLFYAVDDWRSARRRLWQVHEGDWESITVGIGADGAPVLAAYSEHCSGTVRPWRSVPTRGGTHPVAYVALGSHANWFSSVTANTRFAECLKGGLAGEAAARAGLLVRLAQEEVVDRMGSAHPLGPAGLAGVTPLELVELRPGTPRWSRFPGRWGEGQIVWLGSKPRPLTTVSQGYGPGTPRFFATSVSASWHPAG